MKRKVTEENNPSCVPSQLFVHHSLVGQSKKQKRP